MTKNQFKAACNSNYYQFVNFIFKDGTEKEIETEGLSHTNETLDRGYAIYYPPGHFKGQVIKIRDIAEIIPLDDDDDDDWEDWEDIEWDDDEG